MEHEIERGKIFEKTWATLLMQYSADPVIALYKHACKERDNKQFAKAITCYKIHEDMCRKLSRFHDLSKSLNEQGLTYKLWGKLDEALETFQRGEVIARKWKL